MFGLSQAAFIGCVRRHLSKKKGIEAPPPPVLQERLRQEPHCTGPVRGAGSAALQGLEPGRRLGTRMGLRDL